MLYIIIKNMILENSRRSFGGDKALNGKSFNE